MKLRKITALLLGIFILCTYSVAFAAKNELPVAGDLLETDIKAYINGCRISSYNVNGYTAVIAEDLLDYGFSVVWNDTARTVNIKRNDETEFSGILIDDTTVPKIGKKVGSAYYTDIRTIVNGITVLSYNIGGKTAIFIDSLNLFGTVLFSDETRTIDCEISGLTYKKPLVSIVDSDDENKEEGDEGIYVPVPDEKEEQQPTDDEENKEEEPAIEVVTGQEYYSNGFVPDYGYVTGVSLIGYKEKSSSYISYTYDGYDEFAVEKYVSHIVEKEKFEYNKVTQENDTVVYYYTKGSGAIAIEVNNSNKTVTVTCKK